MSNMPSPKMGSRMIRDQRIGGHQLLITRITNKIITDVDMKVCFILIVVLLKV